MTKGYSQLTPDEKKEYHRIKNREHYLANAMKVNDRVRATRGMIQNYIAGVKAASKCKNCPEDHPACLDFHHRDPDDKDAKVSEFNRHGWGLERVKEEIAKCDILCANCHRKLHWNEAAEKGR